MDDITKYRDIDFLFFYGSINLEEETKHDILLGLLQQKRTMFYNRSEGAGISSYENYPNGLSLHVGLRYDIVAWISKRNGEVSAGQGGYQDRRVAVSWNSIYVKSNNNGEIDINVQYIPFANYTGIKSVSIPAGVGVKK